MVLCVREPRILVGEQPRDWDAAVYDRVAEPQTRGGVVLDRLPLDGDETVLDAGCGSGRITSSSSGYAAWP